jgi:hypothetical protein
MKSPNRNHIWSDHDFDPCVTEPIHAARREFMGLGTADHHSRDPGGDDCIDARRRPAVMIARLEGHPGGAAASAAGGEPDRFDLRVRSAGTTGSSLGDHLPVNVCDDASDGGVRLGVTVSAQRPASGSLQHAAVVIVRFDRHGGVLGGSEIEYWPAAYLAAAGSSSMRGIPSVCSVRSVIASLVGLAVGCYFRSMVAMRMSSSFFPT